MKDEPWRGDPAARLAHLEKKIANQRAEILRLQLRLAVAKEHKKSALYWRKETHMARVTVEHLRAALVAEKESMEENTNG